MAKVVALVAVVLLASCSGKKQDKDKDGGVVGGAGRSGATSKTKPMPPPAERMLTCDQAIAKELRDKYVADATLSELKVAVPMTANCKFDFPKDTHPKSLGVGISIQCLDTVKTAMAEMIAALKKQYPDMHDAAGIGAAALVLEIPAITKHVNGAVMIVAFDDDSNCKVDVTASSEFDATAIMKDLLASLPPK